MARQGPDEFFDFLWEFCVGKIPTDAMKGQLEVALEDRFGGKAISWVNRDNTREFMVVMRVGGRVFTAIFSPFDDKITADKMRAGEWRVEHGRRGSRST